MCYKKSDDEAIKSFKNLLRKYKDGRNRVVFIDENVPRITKHNNPNYIHRIDFHYSGKLGSALNSFLKKYRAKNTSEGSLETVETVCRGLFALKTTETTVTKTLIDNYYRTLTMTDSHRAPTTINSYKKVIKLILDDLKKDSRNLLVDFIVPTPKQLKRRNINWFSKKQKAS
ncbi:MAG: hypothetical protein ACPGJV_00760 [Bacteriovoracaceae bacterium]